MTFKKYAFIIIFALFAFLLLVDRYYWSQIAQWREDQATNIWIGYTSSIGNIPVGLISSTGIPNPNGMVILGFILSGLPSLFSISFFLGLFQAILLMIVGWSSFGTDWRYFILSTVPSLLSVFLRSSSVEFWNQYTITLINIFFVFWAVKYLKDQSVWNLPPIIILILSAPSLYLAGITNAVAMTIISLCIVFYKRSKEDNYLPALIIILLCICSSIFLTWIPYFQSIQLNQITSYNKAGMGLDRLLLSAWRTFFGFPVYATFNWTDIKLFPQVIKNADPRITSPLTKAFLNLSGQAHLILSVFAFTSFLYSLLNILIQSSRERGPYSAIDIRIARIVTVSGLFIIVSYTISMWLGGPVWMDGERLDQNIQFLPMFLFIILLLPFMIIPNSKTKKLYTWISFVLLVFFGSTNVIGGIGIVRDHLFYRGEVLTDSDIPLYHKTQVVDFIATDWKEHSDSAIIPVDYNLGGGEWDWVPETGNLLTQWYSAPMTIGRSFDYELLRRYGLTNQQEGIQFRTFGSGRYLVTYVFEDPPVVKNGEITDYIFGRLRVSIVEK